MVCREENGVLVFAHPLIKEVQKDTQLFIQPKEPVLCLNRVRTKTMAYIIRGGKTNGQKIGNLIGANLFVDQCSFGKFQRKRVSHWSIKDLSIRSPGKLFKEIGEAFRLRSKRLSFIGPGVRCTLS